MVYLSGGRVCRGGALTLLLIMTSLILFTLHSPAAVVRDIGRATRNFKSPRIAILTFTTGEKSYTHLSLSNKDVYAKRHGYDLFVDFESSEPRGVMWHKLEMMESVINGGYHDWIWWIDFDTLITNTTIQLEDIISEALQNHPKPQHVDFLLTGDCFQLNAGSMLMRARPSTLDFLNRVRSYGDSHKDLSEQDCIRDLVNNNENGEKEQTLWIPQWKINAFPDEIKCWDDAKKGWERGTFVVHFAGAWAHIKADDPTGVLMRKYSKQIVNE